MACCKMDTDDGTLEGKDRSTIDGDNATRKLTELLNTTGRKLLELKGFLHQEAIWEKFDDATFLPLVARYQNEVGTADAIMMCSVDCETSLSSLTGCKQKYHYYLEELQKIPTFPGQLEKSIEEKNRRQASVETFTKFSPPGLSRSLSQSLDSRTQEVTGNTSFKNVGTDEVDNTSFIHRNVAEETFYGKQIPEEMLGRGGRFSGETLGYNTHPSPVRSILRRSGESSSLSGSTISSHNASGVSYLDDNPVVDSYIPSNRLRADKYKVVRNRVRQRMPVRTDSFMNPNRVVLTPGFAKSPTSSSLRRRTSQECANGTEDTGSTPPSQISSPKQANESWFECQSRLKTMTILESQFQRDSQSPSSSSMQGYFRKSQNHSYVSPADSKKSVRFSLSPGVRSTPTPRKAKVIHANNDFSTDVSDDDHVGFHHKVFPAT